MFFVWIASDAMIADNQIAGAREIEHLAREHGDL